MKKMALLGVAITTMLLFSCQPSAIQEEAFSEAKEVILTAYYGDSPTKTQLVDGRKVYWGVDDEIAIFSAGEKSKFTSLNTEPAASANFRGTISVISGTNDNIENSYIWGLYPYSEEASFSNGQITTKLPHIQTAADGSFADDLLITMGRSLTFGIPFYNVCSGIKFTLAEEGIYQIRLSSNNGEALAGEATLGIDSNGMPVVLSIAEPQTSITLSPPGGGTFSPGVNYYFVTFPVSITGGITFEFLKLGGYSGTRSNSASFSLNRSFFSSIDNLDVGANWSSLEYVDLGLSVKWATCNLGAMMPDDYGEYYAWGEVYAFGEEHPDNSYIASGSRKDSYTNDNYKFRLGAENDLRYSKYVVSTDWGDFGVIDNKTVLDLEDDAAHVRLGGEWRMPTREEFQELVDKNNCSWSAKTINGVNGCLIISKIEGYKGASIFLPAGGFVSGDGIELANSEGSYLSSTLYSSSPSDFWGWGYSMSGLYDYTPGYPYFGGMSTPSRSGGFSIRPVTE